MFIVIGLILMGIAFIWIEILLYKDKGEDKSGLYASGDVGHIIFIFTRWNKSWRPFLLYILGVVIAISGTVFY